MNKIICIFVISLVVMFDLSAQEKKIGLALSGGGALGYAHIGFLQAMHENNLQVQVVSGTSMGAIIGALYSAGYKPMEILEMVEKENMNRAINVIKLNSKINKGFANHEKLRTILKKAIPHNSFDSLNIKFYACMTDFNNATHKLVGSGDLLREYVSASASIPVVFEPVEIEGEQYVDGGLMQNLPVEPLIEENCDMIIGVDVATTRSKKEVTGIANILQRTIFITVMNNTKRWEEKCDYLVRPNLQDFTVLDFDKAEKLFEIGYSAGKAFFENYKL